jgi:hypothetical protein
MKTSDSARLGYVKDAQSGMRIDIAVTTLRFMN